MWGYKNTSFFLCLISLFMIIKETYAPCSQQHKIRYYKLSLVPSLGSHDCWHYFFQSFIYKVFSFIDKIKLYIQLESRSVHFTLQSWTKIFLSTLGSFDLSFLLRVEQQVSEVRRWTFARQVLEGGPWHNHHKAGRSFSSSSELLFWQWWERCNGPSGTRKRFLWLDWWAAFLSIPFTERWLKSCQ